MPDENFTVDVTQSRSGKLFFIILGLLIAGSVFATYYRVVIKKNYIIESQVDCDPYTQKCFIWKCDPASDVDGEKCTGDAEKDIWYYKLARRNASKIPLCDSKTDENCKPMVCDSKEKDCAEVFCDDKNKIEQKTECNDPIEYTKENPPEEDSITSEDTPVCEEGDAACEEASAAKDACAPDDTECGSGAIQSNSNPADPGVSR